MDSNPLTWTKVDYASLNPKQKEDRNYCRIAAILADYGVVCSRLDNDWLGADFLAHRLDGRTLKVQLKARLTIDKKYVGKDLWIAWPVNGNCYVVPHQTLVDVLAQQGRLKTVSWQRDGHYNIGRLSTRLVNSLQSFLLRPT